MKNNVVIMGAGGIGRAACLILLEMADTNYKIFLGDANPNVLADAVNWVKEGSDKLNGFEAFQMPYDGLNAQIEEILSGAAIILDCLPGKFAPRVAKYALDYKAHYTNLTEYVNETNQIIELSKGASTGFLLQTGIAPGYVNVLGMQLYNKFVAAYNPKSLERLTMKVGALTQHAASPHYYGFTWSTIGVATEYIHDSIAVRDFKKQALPSLSEREQLILDGVHYECDLTSGGAANLPDYFEGKFKNLDYKTIRYPGHFDWAKKIVTEQQGTAQQKIDALQSIMETEIPHNEDDLCIIHVAVSGRDENGIFRMIEKCLHIPPVKVGKKHIRSIQATTAGALVESALFLLNTNPKGLVLQSDIEPDTFLSGKIVQKIYEQN